ncbi:MAG: dienelactone hydrolase family protein [Methylobacterium sp.]|jgi:carboxymethylenebutenolidase|nr:dienelactone hydrolase family protein [Methylobacterium sp.]MCA3606716.1 dienelactone hydrolase family protein [Methylobacterium sp.]MCA3608239.1 dienelactone hydrolase family protein [Methylobacterium sp.]MCA3616963.1 dienelactone hydrolase family protein [Methylobacterium sp.]MCA3621448.1 dienelactone hydrolase family protein [Methylobacterium sp.]
MAAKKAQVPEEVIRLYDRFTHGGMDRRAFMERLTQIAGSTAAAAAFLPMLQSNYALAETVKPDDPRLAYEDGVAIPGSDAGLTGYLVAPKGGVKRPALLMIHENRGLNPHIRDMTRRGALAGHLTLGIDALSPEGGTPANEDQARSMFGTLNPDVAAGRCAAAVRFLASHPQSTGKVGAIGFCWGGGQVNRVLAIEPALNAGVSYYGSQIPAERVPGIKGALLLHYASKDERINAGIPAYEAALRANGKTYELHLYEGADHAFNNDTGGARYHPEAAKLAWDRSLAFLARHLGAPPAVG